MVTKRLKFRFYPSTEQETLLSKTFGCCRVVYNSGLAWRKQQFKQGLKPSFSKSSKNLTVLKSQTSWLKEVSSVALQQELRKLDVAFKKFFRKTSGYPKFKKKRSDQSFSLVKSAFAYRERNLSIAKIGRLAIKWSRIPKSDPSSITIIKSASGKYFVSMVVTEPPKPFPKTGEHVGIDLGLNDYATLSTGEKQKGLKRLKPLESKLAKAQRVLSRKKIGSNRRERQRVKVARIHERIGNARRDFLHKLSTELVKRFDKLAIEDLNVKGMMKNRKLSRSIGRESWGMFRGFLTYKAAWNDKVIALCDRFYPSSKTCSSCGDKVTKLALDVREWACEGCGAKHDRDVNAAVNILAAGQVVTAHGEDVRRRRLCFSRQTSLKCEPTLEPALAG